MISVKQANILAIDPATVCGWALRAAGVRTSGVWRLKKSAREPWVARLIAFQARLVALLDAQRVDVVVCERVVAGHSSAASSDLAGAWRAVLEMVCYEAGIQPPLHVYTSQLKKWATGNGRSEKDAMIAAALQRGWRPTGEPDHNEADAWLLLHYAEAHLLAAAREERRA